MLELLKRDPLAPSVPRVDVDDKQADRFSRIRCPLCAWQPEPSTLWACECQGTPEPTFRSCGTLWNTFATGGKCPGCAHQWKWTSCPRCEQWSLHQDWYSEED